MNHSTKTPLANKKILFFSPSFFSYEDRIKTAFEKAGAQVHYYDERCVTSPLSKALLKIIPSFYNRKAFNYYRKIVEIHKDDTFDYILIVRCDMVTPKIIHLLRHSYPNAKLCLHLWDSLKNIKGIKKKLSLFDFVSSFDLNDCNNNSSITFRPLFYSKEYDALPTEKKYDICFCGTIHSDRFFVLKKIMNEAEAYNLKTYVFAYLPSKFMYAFYKLTAKGFIKAKKTDFSFQKMSISDLSQVEKESNVILDIQHPKQTGLTMRTIEILGLNKKIITTNSSIANYDFYNKNNIFIIDRKRPVLDLSFFARKYIEIPNSIKSKYSLDTWILDVLGCNS